MKNDREETYAYCDNDRCRLHLEVAHIANGGVEFNGEGFATTCRSCNVKMELLSTEEVESIREDPDFLKKRKGGDR